MNQLDRIAAKKASALAKLRGVVAAGNGTRMASGTRSANMTCAVTPVARWIVDPLTLPETKEPERINFNGSAIRWADRTWLAYRHGWGRSTIRIAEIEEDTCSVVSDRQVLLPSDKRAAAGREDPKLFTFHGGLWVQSTAYDNWRQSLVCHIRWSQIDPESGAVIREIWPEYPKRRSAEKNWIPFEHEGRLKAIYELSPNVVVLTVDTNSGAANESAKWSGFELCYGSWRGGSTMIPVGDELWAVTHNVHQVPKTAQRTSSRFYSAAVATFAPDTLEPLRYLHPLYLPDESQRWAVHHPSVVFPNGAYLRDGGQILRVSGGHQDRYQEWVEFRVSDIDAELIPLRDGAAWRSRAAKRFVYRRGDSAEEAVNDAYLNNSYKLPRRLKPDDFCLDVGANVGQVTARLWELGSRNIMAVEPVESTADNMRASLTRRSITADVRQVAIGREEGSIAIYTPPSGSAHSTGYRQPDEGEYAVVDMVRLRTLIGDKSVRLLVIDCEGCEHYLAPEDLANVHEIVGECHNFRDGKDMSTLRNVLNEAGFVVTDALGGDTWIFHGKRAKSSQAIGNTLPGDRLYWLLKRLGFSPEDTKKSLSNPENTTGCKCDIRRRQMNDWGADGCVARRAEIVDWLRESANRVSFWQQVKSLPAWIAEVLPITGDPCEAIFDRLFSGVSK